MAYKRKFGGKEYKYDSIQVSKSSAVKRAKEIRASGDLARITIGFHRISHGAYWMVWERRGKTSMV